METNDNVLLKEEFSRDLGALASDVVKSGLPRDLTRYAKHGTFEGDVADRRAEKIRVGEHNYVVEYQAIAPGMYARIRLDRDGVGAPDIGITWGPKILRGGGHAKEAYIEINTTITTDSGVVTRELTFDQYGKPDREMRRIVVKAPREISDQLGRSQGPSHLSVLVDYDLVASEATPTNISVWLIEDGKDRDIDRTLVQSFRINMANETSVQASADNSKLTGESQAICDNLVKQYAGMLSGKQILIKRPDQR